MSGGSSLAGVGDSVAVVGETSLGGGAEARGGNVGLRREVHPAGGAVIISSGASDALSSGEVILRTDGWGSRGERRREGGDWLHWL